MPISMKLGHSPDSDDAFMFYGLAENRVDAEGFEFEHILRDIQTLNEWAKEGKLECTAISVHAYTYVADKYAILSHGASMGDGYGPLIITNSPIDPASLPTLKIAVPGLMTSAFLALGIYLGQPFEHIVVPFDEIMDVVRDGKADAGLLIHEGQLTHEAEGFHGVVDLGKWWKDRHGLPLPLGVNTIRRDLGRDVQEAASRVLKRSIVYGLEHRAPALQHAMQFARDMETATADKFVGMYVNTWTVDLGAAGKRSIRQFLAEGAALGLCPAVGEIDFVD